MIGRSALGRLARRATTDLADHLASVLPRRLQLLDVGARGGLQHPWQALRPIVATVLIEPDSEEAARLAAELAPGEGSVLPVALWSDESELRLRLTKSRGCSSVFEPNRAFLDRFPDADRFSVEEEVPIMPVTIEGLASRGELSVIDFAKIDAQGAELPILQGGRRHLAIELVGLEVEVGFARLYDGQPLFSDVEPFVREELGLELWDIRRTYWKHRSGADRGPIKGQLIFGDALFLRPAHAIPEWIDALGPRVAPEKIAMLVVTALAYGYADYAIEVQRVAGTRSELSGPLRRGLADAVALVTSGFRPLGHGNLLAFNVLDAIAKGLRPAFNGWAIAERSCGSVRRGPFWI